MSLKHRYAAWRELLGHYREHFKWFWKRRHSLTPPALNANEAEFLPAALSLQLAPVSPTARWTARILIMLVLSLLLWACLGKVDIIVSATGKIVLSERTKTIASVETARIAKILVDDGQKVRAGQPLLVLDTGMIEHEQQRAEVDHDMATLQVLRSRVLLASVDAGKLLPLSGTEGISASNVELSRQQLADQWANVTSKLRDLDGQISRYQQQLPLVSQRAKNYRDLAQNRDVAVSAWQEKEMDRIELEGKLADARHQRASFLAETRKNTAEELNTGLKQQQIAFQDIQRAAAHKSELEILAPVDGIVQQLAAHTVGGAVSATTPLMMIVPEHSQIEIEAVVANKDVGFIKKGQKVAVKIEAYDYTKYGMVNGVVNYISRDAMNAGSDNIAKKPDSEQQSNNQQLQASEYTVHVQIDRNSLLVDGTPALFRPGMSTSIEIKTGSRRVIDYFLSPLIQHTHESLNER